MESIHIHRTRKALNAYLAYFIAQLDAWFVLNLNQLVHAPQRRLCLARDQIGPYAKHVNLMPCDWATKAARSVQCGCAPQQPPMQSSRGDTNALT
jgi:hypothetical protein